MSMSPEAIQAIASRLSAIYVSFSIGTNISVRVGHNNQRALRHIFYPGGVYFFTTNLLQRKDNDLLIRHIQHLWESVRIVKAHRWVEQGV
jgi:hypothetical protein